jgi:tetratricopeptide (TPR) repeat protein
MPRFPARPLAALALSLTLAAGPAAAENAGAYLAARVAEAQDDYAAAAGWFARALVADGGNPDLMVGAARAQLALGDVAVARDAARGLDRAGVKSIYADFAVLADLAAREDWAGITAALDEGRTLSGLTDDLMRAWAAVGTGQMSAALTRLDELAARDGAQAFGLFHKALALASVGDFEGADAILSDSAAGPIAITARGVLAHVQILSQLERNPDAIALLDRSFTPGVNPGVDALRTRLEAGEPVPFDTVRSARDGMAEVFHTLASALQGETDPGFALIHARIALHLRPDHADALLLAGDLLQEAGQHTLAAETYAALPLDHPSRHLAEIGRAQALYDGGNRDGAIEALQALARAYPRLLIVQTALADALRREDRFAEAIPAYDAAIALVPAPAAEHWGLFYSRGIAHERNKDWPPAEADFRRALELNPGQPQVLNYLGYSYVDRGENLDEALALIKQAVAAQPDAGYIIDSLAWAYFRLGRYAEALEPMERAALLEPVDPVVTDHLGDVYWAVGRTREAEFQWRRALSFNPEEKEAIRIRRKLEVGLDEVLREEGKPPLHATEAAAPGGTTDGG